MSNDLWRWADPDGQQRRVRLDELRAALAGGHIAPNTPVWRSGWRGWQPAHDVPELTSSALSAANGVVPNIPPPPLAMVAMQHEFEAKQGVSFAPPSPDSLEGTDEPPPPPTYVPLPVKANSIPPPGGSSGRLPPPAASSGQLPPTSPMQMQSSLPTTVGLPPPPELAAMAAAHKATLVANALAISPNGGASTAKDPIIEELSGSMLLDESSSNLSAVAPSGPVATIHAPLGGVPLPPPTNPVLRDEGGQSIGDDGLDEDYSGLPARRPQLTALFDDLKEIKAGRSPKNKLLVGVVAIIALSVLISLVGLVVSLFSGKPSELPTRSGDPSASTSASASGGRATTTPTASDAPTASTAAVVATAPKEDPKTDPPASGPSLGDCALAGEAHVVSPRAFIQSGVEAVPVPGAIALGFAINPRDGIAVSLDPASIGITTTVKARALGGDARRMSPVLEKGKLTLVPDVDKKVDKLQGRRVVNTNPAIDVGIAEGAIVWAPHGQNSYAKLFTLDGEGAVEALRAVPLGFTKGIALSFRRGNSIYVGFAKGDAALTAEGQLHRIAGLGQVGSPTLATSGDSLVVAWSDRGTAQDPWQIRWTKLGLGALPDAPKQLVIPEGGLGAQAMSPSLVGLGSGRFVMTWSEGTPTHQVRAQTLGADGAPSGAAITLSAAGINAGQPQIAVGPDGRGVVAFLAAKGKAYEVHATPISCPAK